MEVYFLIIGSIVVVCTSMLVIGVVLWHFLEWGLLKILQQFKVYDAMIDYAINRKRFKEWLKTRKKQKTSSNGRKK